MEFDGVPRVVISEMVRATTSARDRELRDAAAAGSVSKDASSSASSSLVISLVPAALCCGAGLYWWYTRSSTRRGPTRVDGEAANDDVIQEGERPINAFLRSYRNTTSVLRALRAAVNSRSWMQQVVYHISSAVFYTSIFIQPHPRSWTHKITPRDVMTELKHKHWREALDLAADVARRASTERKLGVSQSKSETIWDRVLAYRLVSLFQTVLHINAVTQSDRDVFVLMQITSIVVDCFVSVIATSAVLQRQEGFARHAMSPKYLVDLAIPSFITGLLGHTSMRILLWLARIAHVAHHVLDVGRGPAAQSLDLRRSMLLANAVPVAVALSRTHLDPTTGTALRCFLFALGAVDMHSASLSETSAEGLHLVHLGFNFAVVLRWVVQEWQMPMGVSPMVWCTQFLLWVALLRQTPWAPKLQEWWSGSHSTEGQGGVSGGVNSAGRVVVGAAGLRGTDGIEFEGDMPPAYVPSQQRVSTSSLSSSLPSSNVNNNANNNTNNNGKTLD
eukprot:PhM_4_TR4553/c0_g1_i1/m.63886